MARQSGIIQYRGRLGETVGMKNGFDGNENFTRSYVAKPKNPQSTSQVDGRAKMLPAVLFNRQLTEVISRGWEGVKYGGPSTRKFMQYALKEPWSNIPQLVKDSILPVPGKYLISRGSLPSIVVTFTNGPESIMTSLILEVSIYSQSTIGEISAALLSANSFLREGDQITFVWATRGDAQITSISYNYSSFYLEPDNTEKLIEATLLDPIGIGNPGTFGVRIVNTTFSDILGAACVLSREGANTHQRSTQRFVLKGSALDAYFASTLKASVAASYQTQSSGRSVQDWPYEGGDVPTTDTRLRILVSASPDEGGTVTGGGRYEEGAQVTLRATPAAGYTFDGWHSGGETLSVNATYTFTAVTNMTIVGEFMEGEQP